MTEQVPLEICAIFKNEARYIKEWLEFHQIIGFTKFHLYNNRSTDNYLEVLNPYIENGIVNLIEWDYEPPCQLGAYADFIETNNKKKIWCAFIDCDEFLFSPRTDMKLLDMVNMIGKPYSIAINWRCFGSSGRLNYSPEPVIERFTFRPEYHEPDKHIKSLIRMDQEVKINNDPHFFLCDSATFNELNHVIIGPFAIHSSELFRINHYFTKSKNEFMEKRSRGRADIYKSEDSFDWTLFNTLEPMDIEDLAIQRFLPELKLRLGK